MKGFSKYDQLRALREGRYGGDGVGSSGARVPTGVPEIKGVRLGADFGERGSAVGVAPGAKDGASDRGGAGRDRRVDGVGQDNAIPLLAPEGVCPSCDRRRALLKKAKKRAYRKKGEG